MNSLAASVISQAVLSGPTLPFDRSRKPGQYLRALLEQAQHVAPELLRIADLIGREVDGNRDGLGVSGAFFCIGPLESKGTMPARQVTISRI
jgi:hypothetical protein